MIKTLKKINLLQNLYRLYLFSNLRVILLVKPLLFLFKKTLGLNIVTRNDLSNDKTKYNVMPYGCEEVIEYGKPYTVEPIPDNISKIIFPCNIKFNKPLIFEVADAEIVGYPPLGFDRDGGIILETTPPQTYSVKDHIEKKLPLLPLLINNLPALNSHKSNVACLLINSWTNNYWQWLINFLTRIEGLEHYKEETGIKPKLIVPRNMYAWQIDSLKSLGYGPDEWIVWNQLRMQVNKLIVPSYRCQYNQQKYKRPQSVAALRWLRNRIINNIPDIDSETQSSSVNVFISRNKAFCRKIVNENEILKALNHLGFVAYTLEEMTFVDQVKLFSQAQIIISPHGAGLANVIFSKNPRIIELFGTNIRQGNAYLTRGLGFKYGCLSGKYSLGVRHQRDGNMIVNIDQLLNLLARMQDVQ